MERNQRQLAMLAALLVALAAIAVYRYRPTPSAVPAQASNPRGAAGQQAAQNAQSGAAPDVRLDALKAERPTPASGERDLFRFKPRAAPAPPPRPTSPGSTGADAQRPPIPVGPPPPPPIPLKFIGIVEKADHTKIAVLSDGKQVHEGTEGGTILGQYKILRIGVESIEMSYLDGRGRQTIRLSGS